MIRFALRLMLLLLVSTAACVPRHWHARCSLERHDVGLSADDYARDYSHRRGTVVVRNRDVVDLRIRVDQQPEISIAAGQTEKVNLDRGLHKFEIIAEVEPGYWKRISDITLEITAVDRLLCYWIDRAGRWQRF